MERVGVSRQAGRQTHVVVARDGGVTWRQLSGGCESTYVPGEVCIDGWMAEAGGVISTFWLV